MGVDEVWDRAERRQEERTEKLEAQRDALAAENMDLIEQRDALEAENAELRKKVEALTNAMRNRNLTTGSLRVPMPSPSEPVLSREEIEEVRRFACEKNVDLYNRLGHVDAIGLAVTVATHFISETRSRVEARERELVCSGCGKPWEGLLYGDPCSIPDERANEREPLTRAEFERRQEATRER